MYFHQKFHGGELHTISDPHFNHKNIVRGVSNWEGKKGTRDFNTVPEMNDAIIEGINNQVPRHHHLIIVGDFLFGDKYEINNLRNRIHCQNVYLVFGNHDDWLRKPKYQHFQSVFSGVFDYLELLVSDPTGKYRLVSFFHYPMKSWNEVNHNGVAITGHEHGNIPYEDHERGFDVGWENFKRPLSMYEIFALADQKKTRKLHHA